MLFKQKVSVNLGTTLKLDPKNPKEFEFIRLDVGYEREIPYRDNREKAYERVRYSDAELQEFKKIIQDKIAKAEKDLALINESFINDQNNGTDDTFPTFKAFEEGAETLSKEQNSILAGRQEKFIRDLKTQNQLK